MYFKIIFIIMIIILSFTNITEGYGNCGILNYYNSKLNSIKRKQTKMDLGYSSNDYIYKTLLMDSDIPLPVNANYWFHKY